MKTFISTDFASVENKAEIRRKIVSLLDLEFWEVESFFFDPLTTNAPDKINYFVDSFPIESKVLLNLSISGLGPGEILLYFLCDNITLSGYKSQIDISANGLPFAEIKAVVASGTPNTFCDFRFGVEASEANHQFLFDIRNFVNHTGNEALLENELEITRTKIGELRKISINIDEYSLNLKITNADIYVGETLLCQRSDINLANKIQFALDTLSNKTPNTFKEIEDKYFSQVLTGGIGAHAFLFFDRKTAKCIYHGKLKKEMMSIERVTQGRIKPYIFIN